MNEKDQPETQFSCGDAEQAYARGRCSGFNLGKKFGYECGYKEGQQAEYEFQKGIDHNGPPGLSKSQGFGVGHSAVGKAIDAGIARAEGDCVDASCYASAEARCEFKDCLAHYPNGEVTIPAVELLMKLGYQFDHESKTWKSNAPSTVELRDDAARALHEALTGGHQVAPMKDIFDAYLGLTDYATDTDPNA